VSGLHLDPLRLALLAGDFDQIEERLGHALPRTARDDAQPVRRKEALGITHELVRDAVRIRLAKSRRRDQRHEQREAGLGANDGG
jgi:hypothetical protein